MMINYRGLSIPFTRMGRVTSDDLFGPNEQVIFDFYEHNADRYRRAVDVGANIGVHSILMAYQGWQVRAAEPDPILFDRLVQNVAAHGAGLVVAPMRAAVSDREGAATFVHVMDNWTGSHLIGAKQSYGPVQHMRVKLVDCRPLFEWADFVKLDCEGHEAVIICALDPSVWKTTDALLEVGSRATALAIYDELSSQGVPLWAQKVGWRRVMSFADVPSHHGEGSLFVGQRPPFRSES